MSLDESMKNASSNTKGFPPPQKKKKSTSDEQDLQVMSLSKREKIHESPETGPERCIWPFG